MKISRNPLSLGNIFRELPNTKAGYCCLALFKSPWYDLQVTNASTSQWPDTADTGPLMVSGPRNRPADTCDFSSLFPLADEPSRCYFHDGDGVCEEFEQMTSIKDCGVYTPKGFLDQWASNVSVSHHSDQQCPGWVVIGQPAATQVRTACSFFSPGSPARSNVLRWRSMVSAQGCCSPCLFTCCFTKEGPWQQFLSFWAWLALMSWNSVPVTQLKPAEVVAGLIQWAVQESPLPAIIT